MFITNSYYSTLYIFDKLSLSANIVIDKSTKDNIMGSFSITHWLILLVVVVIVFGTSKLRNAGKDLGGAVKGFKEAVKDENAEHLSKRRVLDHETDIHPADSKVDTEIATKLGTRVDEIKVSPAPVDDQHKV